MDMSQVASRKVRGKSGVLLTDQPKVHGHLGEILDGHGTIILS
jgi:hypothetical protein